MKIYDELINKINNKLSESKNEPVSFDTEYNQLLLWYIPKSFELDEAEKEMPIKGYDGGMEKERRELRHEYLDRLKGLQEKYNKTATV